MQVLRPGDEMQINTGAIINHPFSATGRYIVEPAIAQEHQQIVSMQLVLRGKNVILMLKPISRMLYWLGWKHFIFAKHEQLIQILRKQTQTGGVWLSN